MGNQIRTLDDVAFALLTSLLTGDRIPVMRDGAEAQIDGQALIQTIINTITSQLLGKFGVDTTITRLEGGTATDLDAKPTVDLEPGYILLISVPLSDGDSYQAQLHQFHSTEAVGDDVVPEDNALKCWKRIL
jgi:hypothetical protein